MSPCTSILPGLPIRFAARLRPSIEPRGAEISHQVLQIPVRTDVVSIPGLIPILAANRKPSGNTQAVSVCG